MTEKLEPLRSVRHHHAMRRTRRSIIAATALGLIAAGLTAAPADAESWQSWYGLRCTGIQVSRCAWLALDRGSGRIRAGGNTVDNPNGGDFSVALNDIQVQVLPFGGPWTTITLAGDYDGWHSISDSGVSPIAGYWCGFQYRALTYHRWTGASSGGEWIASNPVVFC